MVATHPQSVVILGGTSGIGLAAAQALNASGYRVIVSGRESARAERVRKANPEIQTEVADATSERDLERLYSGLQLFDHLVLCVSGAKGAGPLSSLSLDDLRAGFEATVFPQFLAAQLALPHLAKSGSLTFVSAIFCPRGKPRNSRTCSHKRRLRSVGETACSSTETFARECRFTRCRGDSLVGPAYARSS